MATLQDDRGLREAVNGRKGTVTVTYDAGGQATAVDPNPIRPVEVTIDGQTKAKIAWHLKSQNTAPGWVARICNVVLCDLDDTPEDFESVPGGNGKPWTWTWTPGSDRELRPVAYDIFFCYGPSETSKEGRRLMPATRLTRVTSLRQISGLDPSILLPPEPMEPPGPGGGGGGGR